MIGDVENASVRAYTQASWLFSFIAIAALACVVTDLLARSRSIEHWEMAESSALSQSNGKVFSNTGNFIDFEERLLLDEIPNSQFSEGGVYFFGTSNMKWAFTTWDLPPRLRGRLHNYGIGDASHQTVLRLVRYLIDRGALRAGQKSEVVIGGSFHLGNKETQTSYFPLLVRRQNLYAITRDDRLVETDLRPLERRWRIEKARSSGFIRNLGRLASNWMLVKLRGSHQPAPDPVGWGEGWRPFMGPNWAANIDREVGYLGQTITLVHSRNIPVKVVLLPQGTWMNRLPFGQYYDARVRALCESTSTPLVDWSKTLPDSDFVDSNHLSVRGQAAFRKMMLNEEAAYLAPVSGQSLAVHKVISR